MKLHIIAGQMNTEQMTTLQMKTFYTLTGKSGEIFNGDKVRVSPISKLSTEQWPQLALGVWGSWKIMRTFSPGSLFVRALPYVGKEREPHRTWSGGRAVGWPRKESVKWLCSKVVFKATITQLPAGGRNFTVNLFPGSISTKPDQHSSDKRKRTVCSRLPGFTRPLQLNSPLLLMPLILFCF